MQATYGDRVEFVGIGGQAPGGDYQGFIDGGGTGAFTHLQDDSGELWDRFGTGGRSTFMFVGEDGSFVLTTYGVVDEEILTREVERLIAS